MKCKDKKPLNNFESVRRQRVFLIATNLMALIPNDPLIEVGKLTISPDNESKVFSVPGLEKVETNKCQKRYHVDG